MSKATKITIAALALTAVGYLASFLIPLPARWTGTPEAFHLILGNSVLYTLLHIGAAALLLAGVGAYKSNLRSAYIKIAAGIVLVAAGLAQVVFLNIFGLIQTPWVQYGGVMLPFVIAGLAIYFGTRSIAKLVGITSPLTKARFVFPLLIILIILAGILPHRSSSLPELFFDISNAISTWDVVLYGASFGLTLEIKNHIGMHYTQSMAWLALGLLGSVVITVSILVGTFVLGRQPEGPLVDTLVIVGGLLYLKAGHSFAKTEEI